MFLFSITLYCKCMTRIEAIGIATIHINLDVWFAIIIYFNQNRNNCVQKSLQILLQWTYTFMKINVAICEIKSSFTLQNASCKSYASQYAIYTVTQDKITIEWIKMHIILMSLLWFFLLLKIWNYNSYTNVCFTFIIVATGCQYVL